MIIVQTLNKKNLEKLIKTSFFNFGSTVASQLLDSIKAFGFFYATSSGLSISLEDLKSPDKRNIINDDSETSIIDINTKWTKGIVTSNERFQYILNHWIEATEALKNDIINYYKIYDPANSLYIMASSGARGNISQVRQIVGARGLMMDQAGNVITFPIESNFFEGLTSIDYLISAYGARKGIVDTALKTATAGYLTRRLIFLAQDITIRQINCNTKSSLLIDLKRNTNLNNLIGRYCEAAIIKKNSNFYFFPKITNTFLTKKNCNFIKSIADYLYIKSPLTCKIESSLCQYCYGWDLSKYSKISLGQTVGIISAQSIGEPGTQLTMRTFHTGGVFNSNFKEQFFKSPVSGKILYYKNISGFNQKDIFGQNVIKLSQNLKIKIFNWKKGISYLYIPKGLEVLIKSDFFINKNNKIANFSSSKILDSFQAKSLVPIYFTNSGKIIEKKIVFKPIQKGLGISLSNSRLSILLGKSISCNSKTKLRSILSFNTKKSLGYLNIFNAPKSGFIYKGKDFIIIYTKNKKLFFDFQNAYKLLKNFLINRQEINLKKKIVFFTENFQFIDKESVCARLEFFPNFSEISKKIYITNKCHNLKKNIFIISNSDLYNLYTDQVINVHKNVNKKKNFNFGDYYNSQLKYPIKGRILEKNGSLISLEQIKSFAIPKGALFYTKINKKFISKGELFYHSIIYKKQANDIVQGLPKIDEIIEAKVKEAHKSSTLISGNGILFYNKDIDLNYKIKYSIKPINYHILSLKNTNLQNSAINKGEIIIKPSIFFTKQKNNLVKQSFSNICEQKHNFSYIKLDSSKEQMKEFFTLLLVGQTIYNKNINPHLILFSIYNYYYKKEKSKIDSCQYAIRKLQLILTNCIQSIYFHQGVNISSKHIELIVKQLLSKALVFSTSSHIFNQKNFIHLSILLNYYQSINNLLKEFEKLLFLNSNLKKNHNIMFKNYLLVEKNIEKFKIFPIYLGCTNNSLIRNTGFLSAASFQDTKRILTQASLLGYKDWLSGLKDSIIVGKYSLAGSTYLYNKNYLDTFYLYKTKK